MYEGHRYDSWLTEKVEIAMKAITRNIERSIWRDLMLKSGMIALMDAQARDQWYAPPKSACQSGTDAQITDKKKGHVN